MTFFDDVAEWHRKVLKEPKSKNERWLCTDEQWTGRIRLILEELSELSEAQAIGDEREFADALADLTFVVLGTAVVAGVPFNQIWDEVLRSNMSKVGGKIDSGGKLIKPDNYYPPDFRNIFGFVRNGPPSDSSKED